MSRPPAFIPDQFRLSHESQEQGFTLNPEIASDIANAVFEANNATHDNVHSYGHDLGFYIDTSGRSTTHGHFFDRKSRSPYQASFYVDNLTGVNGIFGREVQKALDWDEHTNRLGSLASLAMLGAPSLVIEGATIGVASYNKTPAPTIVIGSAASLALGGLLIIRGGGGYHLYRRALTNPETPILNRRHLERAREVAGRLRLGPLLQKI